MRHRLCEDKVCRGCVVAYISTKPPHDTPTYARSAQQVISRKKHSAAHAVAAETTAPTPIELKIPSDDAESRKRSARAASLMRCVEDVAAFDDTSLVFLQLLNVA